MGGRIGSHVIYYITSLQTADPLEMQHKFVCDLTASRVELSFLH